MAIITLSRELGSLGTEIADMLASRLRFARLDKESLEVLLKASGMSQPHVGEDDEKKPGFWEKLTREKVRYLDFMKAALYRYACEKDCLIVGRGANMIFRGVPAALRLRIVAPLTVRAERVRVRLGVDEQHALRMIHQSDHDRAGYHRYFFNASWDSSADFDLVVNTAAISPAQACETVAALMRSPAYAGAAGNAREVLRDLRMAQDAIIAIVYRERVPVVTLDAVADKGVVALAGAVRSQADVDWCVGVAARVEGVSQVVSNLQVVDYTYYPGI
jgi:cytidylate kinase